MIAVLKFRKAAVDKRDLHGATVTRQLCSTATELAAFTRRWRQWFLDSMKPQHLSKHWDVNHSKPNDDTEENFNDNGDGNDENEDEEKRRSKSSGRVRDSQGRNSGRRPMFADKTPAVGNPDWKPPTEQKDVSKMTPEELAAAGLTSYGAPMGPVSSPAVATAAVPIAAAATVTSTPAAAVAAATPATPTAAVAAQSPISSISSSRSRNSNDDDDTNNRNDDGDEDDTSPAPEASPSSSRNGNDNDEDDENDEEITPASVQPALED